MKNKILLTACFLALFSFARAEDESGANVHFILFGGFNSSKTFTEINSKQTVVSEAKQNYNFGAGLRVEFARILFIQPEIYFTRKGGLANAFRPNATDTFNQHHVDMQSIDMPIMFGLRLFHSDRFCFRAYGGPVFSFLKNQNVEIDKNDKPLSWSEIQKRTKAFSMQIGAGVDITRLFTFDVRYEYGLSPMFKISDFKTNYSIIYFTAGIKLF